MPNNCVGSLVITASEERRKEILNSFYTNDEYGENLFDFNKIIPRPEEEEENWYHWNLENWGTKWSAQDVEIEEYEDAVVLNFWTAWSSCSEVIETLAEKYPDAEFKYSYEEPGCCFCGYEEYQNGECVYQMEADYEEIFYDEDENGNKIDFDGELLDFSSHEDMIEDGKISICEDMGDFFRIIEGEYDDYRDHEEYKKNGKHIRWY